MRTDPALFAAANSALTKSPRFVARIVYDIDSLALTSHAGITGVTAGTILEGVLVEPTVTSQRLRPDDAVAEIGSASFTLADVGSQFTSEINERLVGGAGLRGKTVQFYVGYDGLAFADFVLIATQIVSSVTFNDGVYQVACLDVQRTLRQDIFEPRSPTLASSVAIGDVTINLTNGSTLQLNPHGTSYTDSPSVAVGYVKIKTEIIRYTGITGNTLTGCTRGVLGTVAAAYAVDAALAADRREKVTEYIYLELPAVKLAYAVLTGIIHGNLLVNPSFETDSNADGLSDSWQNYVNSQTYTRVAGRLSGFAQRFQGTGPASPRMTKSAGVFVSNGRKFTISAWV